MRPGETRAVEVRWRPGLAGLGELAQQATELALFARGGVAQRRGGRQLSQHRRRRDLRSADLLETLAWPGFRRLAVKHWRMGLREIYGSLSQRAFLASARRYLPELTMSDVVAAPSGVRAQAVDADGTLVDDFRIGHVGHVVTIRNAPSPAATSALAIAEHAVAHIVD